MKQHFCVVVEMLHPTDNAGEILDELPAQVKKAKMQKKTQTKDLSDNYKAKY